MDRITAAEIADRSGGKVIKGDPARAALGAETDSRKISEADLFVALKGTVTDGHRFLKRAADAGASVLMVSDPDAPELALIFGEEAGSPDGGDKPAVVLVGDTLKGLQELAAGYIKDRPMLKVAVTGSVGKTSTRDLLHAALSVKYVTGKNKANYNSSTGLPLTLLDLTSDMEAAVLEMGMESAGEIRRLAEIAVPDMAVITNIGISHIERLGSRENIRLAKMEVAEKFGPENTLIVNGDDDMLGALKAEELPYKLIKVVTEGSGSDESSYLVKDIRDRGIDGVDFVICGPGGSAAREAAGFPVHLTVPGAHNAINASLALAAACAAGISLPEAIKGIESAELTGSRLRVVRAGDLTLIDDAYNAAPESMISALRTLSVSDGTRRIAVLAGMNELGTDSREEHRRVGREAGKLPLDLMVTIGEKGSDIGEGAAEAGLPTMRFDTKEEFMERAAEVLRPGDTILFKASRSFALEETVQKLADKGNMLWA